MIKDNEGKEINIVSERDGIVLTDRKCSKCGDNLRISEVMDFKDLCEYCS